LRKGRKPAIRQLDRGDGGLLPPPRGEDDFYGREGGRRKRLNKYKEDLKTPKLRGHQQKKDSEGKGVFQGGGPVFLLIGRKEEDSEKHARGNPKKRATIGEGRGIRVAALQTKGLALWGSLMLVGKAEKKD